MLVVGSGFLKYKAAFQPNKLDFVLSSPQALFSYLSVSLELGTAITIELAVPVFHRFGVPPGPQC